MDKGAFGTGGVCASVQPGAWLKDALLKMSFFHYLVNNTALPLRAALQRFHGGPTRNEHASKEPGGGGE